jgi:pyrroloquinoline quinone (PQQ) biosynthesis protein C
MASRLERITKDYRAKLLQADKIVLQSLQEAHNATLATIQPQLDKLYKQIQAKLQAGESIPVSWLYQEKRLETIKALISDQMDQYGIYARQTVGNQEILAVRLGTDMAQTQLRATVPSGVNWSFGIPQPGTINAIMGANRVGSPLFDLFSSFGPMAAKEASKALVTGVTLGMSPKQIAPMVRQALDVPRWKALSIAKTETFRAYRQATVENYRANSHVVDTWIWFCSLSVNSCAACIAMHGTEHSLEETLDEHVNGSCSMIPRTKSWEDILGPYGIDTSGLEDTRASIERGTDWFEKQSEATQRNILGSSKYDAWSSGAFAFSDVVGHSEHKDWGGSIYEKPLKALV